MKKMPSHCTLFTLLLFVFAGCAKNKVETTTYRYTIATPVFSEKETVWAAMKTSAPEPVTKPGKMYIKGKYIYLNETGKGIHIINNTNPRQPVNEAFIPIPGCEDMAVAANILYADCYQDLMVLDIANPQNVRLLKRIPDMFPDKKYAMGYYIDSTRIITDWILKDTTVQYPVANNMPNRRNIWFDAASFSSASLSKTSAPGTGGSMARFAVHTGHLYAVTSNSLQILNLENPAEPEFKNTLNIGWGIETIFPFKENLFIGSNTGMLIYNLNNPSEPERAGVFTHARVCDPVIADDTHAYVTLRSGTMFCGGNINQLDVVDIKNIYAPTLIKTYPMTHPKGLSKDGNVVFVCDENSGIRVMDASNPDNLIQRKTINLKGSYDIICMNRIAIVSAEDGLYQYDYSNLNQIRFLSKVGWQTQ